MADSVGRRRSRGNPKSYKVAEAYSFLDSDDEGVPGTMKKARVRPADEDEDSDTFMPDENEDVNEDELMEDEIEEEEEEDEEEEEEEEYDELDGIVSQTPSRKVRPRKSNLGSAVAAGAVAGLYKGRAKVQQQAGAKSLGVLTPESTKKKAPASTQKSEKVLKRGIDDWGRGTRGGGLENRIKDLFGPVIEDLKPILQTRDFWAHQHTLPAPEESLRESFYVSEAAMKRDCQKLRDWYCDTGTECFSHGQSTRSLSEEEGTIYLENRGRDKVNILMGPVGDPQVFSLEKGASLSTADPFPVAKDDRRGWVIYMGSKVRDAQWAPNENGSTQYLAVAVEQRAPEDFPKQENPSAPAFSATDQFASSIQIWGFQSTEDGELDSSKEPSLELVICTEWGAPMQLKWCPFALADSAETADGKIHLGLLASWWSDGRVRILDISYSKPEHAQTQYVFYGAAAFEAKFPSTVPTCIHWLSSTSLAATTAAGTLAVWTLTRPDAFPTAHVDGHYNPQPWFYKLVADTFILTLSSGWPSRPNFVSITTADGYSKMIDMRSPEADTAETGRGRIFGLTQTWHEHTQSFVMSDEIQLLRSNTIRRYYSNIHTMRSDAQITCSATSLLHPGVLLGSADGVVRASNPISRILNYKEVPWQQIWFTHEWRPEVERLHLRVRGSSGGAKKGSEEVEEDEDGEDKMDEDEGEQGRESSDVSSKVLSQPLSRFIEGYRVQQTVLQPVKGVPGTVDKDAIRPITVYEEPSAITTLAWNPNLKYGAWAVAGMGDGLLRVEDLGVIFIA